MTTMAQDDVTKLVTEDENCAGNSDTESAEPNDVTDGNTTMEAQEGCEDEGEKSLTDVGDYSADSSADSPATNTAIEGASTIDAQDLREPEVPDDLMELALSLRDAMSDDDADQWMQRFFDAAPEAASASRASRQWLIWVLTDPESGALKHVGEQQAVRDAIERVVSILEQGKQPQELSEAGHAAADAAEAAETEARSIGWPGHTNTGDHTPHIVEPAAAVPLLDAADAGWIAADVGRTMWGISLGELVNEIVEKQVGWASRSGKVADEVAVVRDWTAAAGAKLIDLLRVADEAAASPEASE